MKAFLLAAVVSTATLAPQAFAQGRNFEGFSVGANATSSSVGTDAKGLGVSDKFGDSSENFGLQAAYGFPMGSNGVLGLGGTYTLADFNAGNISSGSTAMKLKGKDMYSLYVEPGFLVNPSTLIFAKAAYISMKGETSIVGSTGGSENFDGLGYGAGVRMSFGKSAFWQFELTQSDYNAKTVSAINLKPSAFNRTIGVGFRF
ncbi:MAG: outer membrane beta-barrel protein [Rhodoferax sp.]|nr:outer membrane beta-barrel protein [Rhodoferax sp.]